MLSDNFETTKIRKTDSQDTMSSSGMVDLQSTPTPPHSGRSSPSYQSNSVSPTPPALSPQINHNGGGSQSNCSTSDYKYSDDFDGDEQFDPSIPDASNWTHDDVYNYFAQYFPEEATVFKEQVTLFFSYIKNYSDSGVTW